jgi:hypothetical protein
MSSYEQEGENVMKALLRFSLIVAVALTGLSSALAQDETPTPQPPVLGAINIIAPELYHTPAGGQETRLVAHSVINPGDTLRTDENGTGLITWFYDGTESVLGPNSSLTLNDFSGEAKGAYVINLTLHSGHLISGLGGIASDLSTGGSWILSTPAFNVKLLRGQFEVTVADNGAATLAVTQGRVEVTIGSGQPFPVDANQYLLSTDGAVKMLSDDGVTPNLTGVCTATAKSDLNIRLAPNQDSRRLGGVKTDQVFWVESGTEGNLWIQVYYQTPPEDEEGHNYGWVYGPAVTLDESVCAVLTRAPLDARMFGGPGIENALGTAGESEPIPTPTAQS